MKELQRLQASRRGHRGHLTKLFKKSQEIIEQQTAMNELTRALAETTVEQLGRKRDILKGNRREYSAKNQGSRRSRNRNYCR